MSKALLKAAATGQIIKLEAILTDGVDIDFTDKLPGRTALIEAAIAGHADMVACLLKRGANLNLMDRTLGYTALGWAANQGYCEVVNQLLAAGATVDLTSNQFQRTPLMNAAMMGHHEVTAALLAAGANLHIQTGDGRNAWSMAEANHHTATSNLLQQHGAQLPKPPQEVSLSWPNLTEVDHKNPASVLRGFILAMHQWETDCNQHVQMVGFEQLDWEYVLQGQNQVFAQFCTVKARPQGRYGNFSTPPEYAAEEALLHVDIKASRATLMTRQGHNGVMRYEMLYTLICKANIWRVDSKKSRPFGTENWTQDIL